MNKLLRASFVICIIAFFATFFACMCCGDDVIAGIKLSDHPPWAYGYCELLKYQELVLVRKSLDDDRYYMVADVIVGKDGGIPFFIAGYIFAFSLATVLILTVITDLREATIE